MHPLIPWFEPFKIPISGDFAIHGFGILVALGFVFGAQQAMRKVARDGYDPQLINKVVTWIVVGVFVGGHLGHLLFYYPEELLEDPMSVFRVWSGLSSFGGFFVSAVLVVWFFKKEDKKVIADNRRRKEQGEPLLPRVRFWPYGDALAYGLTLGWFLGRMGCFTAHDHPGLETEFWLGVQGMCPGRTGDADFACHDLGLYEGVWSLGMFIVFWFLDKKPRFPGFFIAVLVMAYGPFRLFLDIFRHPDTDTRYFGFTPAQMGSVLIILIGVWIFVTQRNKEPMRAVATTGQAKD